MRAVTSSRWAASCTICGRASCATSRSSSMRRTQMCWGSTRPGYDNLHILLMCSLHGSWELPIAMENWAQYADDQWLHICVSMHILCHWLA